ncbi:transcriptional regulator, TetR family [Seinonella peptonophila]|uniref:Transcriptional regulator, TetR family n=1 Tax=Seinonella peptonophila TaxID=112248 RepID=A0A1M4X8W5_9BACL|nr:TetR/AcrR family transcriptional regulator [Seinonella peptonophila]SHE89893.1 transcriptional regulator, TetR family [Seinonella peptonophila]
MPTDTFYNLNEQKQQRIFDAAIQEFSKRRFSEASINQIVKAAGISRGSFYQYFKDKGDLYLYILQEIGNEKRKVMKQVKALHPNADFFTFYLQYIKVAMEWISTNPAYHEIGMLMEFDDPQLMKELMHRSDDLTDIRELLELDQRRGLIKEELDTGLLLEMIYQLSLHLVKKFYQTGSTEEFVKKHHELILILKDGIVNKSERS